FDTLINYKENRISNILLKSPSRGLIAFNYFAPLTFSLVRSSEIPQTFRIPATRGERGPPLEKIMGGGYAPSGKKEGWGVPSTPLPPFGRFRHTHSGEGSTRNAGS